MAFERGRFGLEYDLRQTERKPSGHGWIFVVALLVALVSLAWTMANRIRTRLRERQESREMEVAAVEPTAPPVSDAPAADAVVPSAAEVALPTPPSPPPEPEPAVQMPGVQNTLAMRPAKVRNLLMRLEEAEKSRDVEMAVTTIEQIRALPGSPAADLDDALARRLGELNMRRLFELKNAQWVKTVVVKRGDNASRIASERGSTLASMVRLNGAPLDKIILGSKLYVMDHPRFNLVFHRRSRTADLALNGKFFKRYDLAGELRAKVGAYELSERKRIRQLWNELGAQFNPDARAELEMLLPAGTPVLVSEM